MTRHVCVLLGGLSAEREVSLVTGDACALALDELGYRVTRLDVGADLPQRLLEIRPDCCFNALHGKLGEDGRVQGLLDLLAIPYTHSGVLASAAAMDKPFAKRLFASAGLTVPQGRLATLRTILDRGSPLDGPIVVKPADEGSSVGVFVLADGDLDPIRRRNQLDLDARMLVERYVPGRELTCAVLGREPLAVTEIAPREGFYDYRAKYTEGVADHLLPAPIPDGVRERVLDWSLRAHDVLGCRGLSRADFRYDPEAEEGDDLFILELNSQPGMTPLSLVPEQAAFRDIPFASLIGRLVEEARCDR